MSLRISPTTGIYIGRDGLTVKCNSWIIAVSAHDVNKSLKSTTSAWLRKGFSLSKRVFSRSFLGQYYLLQACLVIAMNGVGFRVFKIFCMIIYLFRFHCIENAFLLFYFISQPIKAAEAR